MKISGCKTVAQIYENVLKEIGAMFEVSVKNGKMDNQAIQEVKETKLIKIKSISLMLIALEFRSKEWKDLQFKHVSSFPKIKCTKCHTSQCFSCTEVPFHENRSWYIKFKKPN